MSSFKTMLYKYKFPVLITSVVLGSVVFFQNVSVLPVDLNNSFSPSESIAAQKHRRIRPPQLMQNCNWVKTPSQIAGYTPHQTVCPTATAHHQYVAYCVQPGVDSCMVYDWENNQIGYSVGYGFTPICLNGEVLAPDRNSSTLAHLDGCTTY